MFEYSFLLHVFTELKKLLKSKEEQLTDVRNLLHHRTDDVEHLAKVLEDADKQLINCLKQIKMMAEKGARDKELKELKAAVQTIVDMVDPPEEGVVSNNSLADRLREAPQRIADYVSKTTKTYVTHVLGLVKSFWTKARMEVVTDSVALDCP